MQLYTDSIYYHCTIHQSDRHLPFLLMLHGFMGTDKVFDHLIEELSFFCNPITIDLAGHGKTDSPANPEFYLAERQAGQLKSILQRLKFDNLWLYGYSMGGRLAFQLLASFPELISGAVIESSHCGIESAAEKAERRELDEKRARQLESDFDGFIDEWMKMPLFQHTPSKFRTLYEKVMRQQNAGQISASLHGFGAGVMPAVCGQIKNTDQPVTLITGEQDQKYVKLMSRIEKNYESAALHIIKNAGHRVHTDQPKEVLACLKKTLNQN